MRSEYSSTVVLKEIKEIEIKDGNMNVTVPPININRYWYQYALNVTNNSSISGHHFIVLRIASPITPLASRLRNSSQSVRQSVSQSRLRRTKHE